MLQATPTAERLYQRLAARRSSVQYSLTPEPEPLKNLATLLRDGRALDVDSRAKGAGWRTLGTPSTPGRSRESLLLHRPPTRSFASMPYAPGRRARTKEDPDLGQYSSIRSLLGNSRRRAMQLLFAASQPLHYDVVAVKPAPCRNLEARHPSRSKNVVGNVSLTRFTPQDTCHYNRMNRTDDRQQHHHIQTNAARAHG